MTHPSPSQLERFCVCALAEDELIAVAEHVADCSSCHDRFIDELRRKNGSAPFAVDLTPEFSFRHDHLEFEQLVDLADGKLDRCMRQIIDIHLRTCETCREDVRSFLAFRKAETKEPD